MKKIFLLFIFCIVSVNAQTTNLIIKQKKALYVQNMIKVEEKIAYEYERYLLQEFKIPTITTLSTNEFLGVNFSTRNNLGDDIDFKSNQNLEIKFAIKNKVKHYIVELYKRDLYRQRTSVFIKNDNTKINNVNYDNSYVKIDLKSDEAINIHKILLGGARIDKHCDESDTTNTYCSYNPTTIRWYYSNASWIEYSKKDFELGNVTIKNVSLSDSKLQNLAVGTYIYEENGSKFLRLENNSIMKVE